MKISRYGGSLAQVILMPGPRPVQRRLKMAAGGPAMRGPEVLGTACGYHPERVPRYHPQSGTGEMNLGQGILLRDTGRGVMANAYWRKFRSLGFQGAS
jgi:hypothetical protein